MSIFSVNFHVNSFHRNCKHALISLTKQFMLFHAYMLVHNSHKKNCIHVFSLASYFLLLLLGVCDSFMSINIQLYMFMCGVYTYCTLYTVPKRTPEDSHFTLYCTCRLEPIRIQQKLIFLPANLHFLILVKGCLSHWYW